MSTLPDQPPTVFRPIIPILKHKPELLDLYYSYTIWASKLGFEHSGQTAYQNEF